MDYYNKSCDPYFKIIAGQYSKNTSVQEDTQNPYFFERVKLPVIFPFLIEDIQIVLMESNVVQDIEVSQIIISMARILSQSLTEPKWYHLYGTPNKIHNQAYADYIFNKPQYGSTYRGSVLISIDIQETEKASMELEKLDQNLSERVLSPQAKIVKPYQIEVNLEYLCNISMS